MGTHVAAMLLTALPFLLLLIPSSSYHLDHLVHLVHLIHLVHLVNSSPSHLVHLLPPHSSNGKFPLDRPPHLPPPPSYTLLGHQQDYHHPALPPLPHPVLLHPQELQRHECWVGEAVEENGVCHPLISSACDAQLNLTSKQVISVELCYNLTRTVCTVIRQPIEDTVCRYSYLPRLQTTHAKTVQIVFTLECSNHQVTVCHASDYRQHALGLSKLHCQPLMQRRCFHTPVLKIVEPLVKVSMPHLEKTCAKRTISLPQVMCEDVSRRHCIQVPEVKEVEERGAKKCKVHIQEECREAVLELPKQACRSGLEGDLSKPTLKL